QQVAAAVGAHPTEVVFASGGSEANNLFIKGAAACLKPGTVAVSAIEHPCVREPANDLKRLGWSVHEIAVDAEGRVAETDFSAALAKKPGLVSVMLANNETGVIFPLSQVAALTRARGALLHVDAVQAPGKMDPGSIDADMVSLSSHKIGGSKGMGALWVRRGTPLTSLLHGGAQERRRRAGTIHVAGVASFQAAAEALEKRDLAATRSLRDWLEAEVRARIPGAVVQGASQPRIANTSNFLFDGVRGEALLMGLDVAGFAVSSGSACNSGSILPSHVLLAMGFSREAASSAVRVSLGPSNTREELAAFVSALEELVDRIRARRNPANP
ncbi:MAG: cysteine desulfurase, partial [Bdellovibrionales bacterium]|nr:cysteine desulfurase [Bdellovibrionales bacterium]